MVRLNLATSHRRRLAPACGLDRAHLGGDQLLGRGAPFLAGEVAGDLHADDPVRAGELPALLRSKGRIVNISSVGGKVAMASYGAYAGSKFALEAMSDALRREMAPHGVRVVVVEPGGVRTEMSDRGIATANRLAAEMTPEQRERHGPMMQAIVSHTRAFTEAGLPADRAARIIANAVTDRRPRIRYTIGRDAAMLARLTRILPDRLLDRAVAATLRPHYPAP